MAPAAVTDPLGRNTAWSAYAAAYLFRGDFSDETGNGRTLISGGTAPVIVSNTTENGLSGGVSNAAAAGFLSHANDPSFDGQPFEMFGIGICPPDTGGNQIMMGMVDSTSSNTTRRLLGIRDSNQRYIYFTDEGSVDWHEGRTSIDGETVSLSFSGREGVAERVDGFLYVDGQFADGVDAGQLSADTIQVLSGRGTSSSTDWRGICYMALFSLSAPRGDDWHRALHENFRQARGIFEPGQIINSVVGLQ